MERLRAIVRDLPARLLASTAARLALGGLLAGVLAPKVRELFAQVSSVGLEPEAVRQVVHGASCLLTNLDAPQYAATALYSAEALADMAVQLHGLVGAALAEHQAELEGINAVDLEQLIGEVGRGLINRL